MFVGEKKQKQMDINIENSGNSACTSQLTGGILIPVCFIAHVFFSFSNVIYS